VQKVKKKNKQKRELSSRYKLFASVTAT